MKTLEEQMSFYLRYHRNPKNKLTHFVGVPLITRVEALKLKPGGRLPTV